MHFMVAVENLTKQINRLSLRERLLLTITGVVLLFILIHEAAVAPIKATQVELTETLALQIEELATKQRQFVELEGTAKKANHLTQQNSELKQEIESASEKINQYKQNIVLAKQMPQLLNAILKNFHRIQLINLENVSSDELGELDESSKLYQHGLQLTVQGDFSSIISLAKKLEMLKPKVIIGSYNFQIKEFPEATMQLNVYSISTDQYLIGI